MEKFSLSISENGLTLENIPDAVMVVNISDHKLAKRLSDLTLHRNDLIFAKTSIQQANLSKDTFIREALWRSAIVHFCKCFGKSNSRELLDFDEVYKGEQTEAKVVFDYFKHLRNKNVVHDENSYSQALPGAVLNNGTKPYKVEKIVCLDIRAGTFDEGNFSNLMMLIDRSLKWIVEEFDKSCSEATKQLEELSYSEISNKTPLQFNIPSAEDVGKRRK